MCQSHFLFILMAFFVLTACKQKFLNIVSTIITVFVYSMYIDISSFHQLLSGEVATLKLLQIEEDNWRVTRKNHTIGVFFIK